MIRSLRIALAIAIASLCVACATHSVHSATDAPAAQTLTLIGFDGRPPIHLDALPGPRQTVTATMHGETHAFEGVPLAQVLEVAGAPLGTDLRGDALRVVVLITARDGYQVVLSLAEIDPGISGRTILIADEKDAGPLAEDEGPYRLVVEGDVRTTRSARMVERIELRMVD